ncbi:MAG: phosphatase PAP2 family protein [Gallionella sp.]|nr:phosphatase PAP2 family protein [Gallionella sp.]
MLEFIQSLDTRLLIATRSVIDLNSPGQVFAVRLFADINVFASMLVMVGLWLYGSFHQEEASKREALSLFYAMALALGIYWLLNFGLPVRPRPELTNAVKPLISHIPDNSFPSGHAIYSGAFATAAFLFLRKKFIAWFVLVLGSVMALCRVIAGIHYPGDIIAGAALGVGSAFLFQYFLQFRFIREDIYNWPIRIAKLVKL